MSGDLLRCRRALVKLERGARAQSKLKFPIEKDNIRELRRAREVGPWIGPQYSIGLPRLPYSPALLYLMLHGVLAGAVTCWTWTPSAGDIR